MDNYQTKPIRMTAGCACAGDVVSSTVKGDGSNGVQQRRKPQQPAAETNGSHVQVASEEDVTGKGRAKQSTGSHWLSYLAVVVLAYLSYATYPPSLSVTQVHSCPSCSHS